MPLARISLIRSRVSHPSEQAGNRFFISHFMHGLLTSCPTSKSNLLRTTLIPLHIPLKRNPPVNRFVLDGTMPIYHSFMNDQEVVAWGMVWVKQSMGDAKL